jgi:hypothetical protein
LTKDVDGAIRAVDGVHDPIPDTDSDMVVMDPSLDALINSPPEKAIKTSPVLEHT